jgi:hypothetical protein
MERDISPGQQTNPPRPGSILSRIELEGRVGIEPTSLRWKRRVKPLNYLPAFVILASLSACQPSAVRVQYISVPTYVPVPATLTAPVSVSLIPGKTTWGEALGLYNEAVQTCNARLGSIATLVPPQPK